MSYSGAKGTRAPEISDNVYGLVVQRELVGYFHENPSRILEVNGIASAVLSKLGLLEESCITGV